MEYRSDFSRCTIDELPALSSRLKAEGWRFVQMLCANTDDGIDMVYSFMKDGHLVNYEIKGVTKGDVVPSITNDFIAAFVFENESHDLFGVNISDIAIDFKGHFYDLAQAEPMTIISPAQKAAKEKAAKLAAAKAAKEKAAAAPQEDDAAAKQAELEAKLAAMDPEKAAKVRAAMEAKAKKEAAALAQAKEKALEEKLAGMDPEKAAKVRAAMAAKAAQAASAKKGGE
ncbi:NADH-quinone oxidoreductase subunit C [Adlercreutzia sp. ZJ141]|uniref:NADH-quinone oxidoreductase subunit C n=1 Tax=Adlercreutzia sp. ZJ141 TaxID=2709406 RepID=UPI0013E9E810|nr:NADH-quinone oxidoreductase subunit C [Adlercreutzia sp. ZJ141]